MIYKKRKMKKFLIVTVLILATMFNGFSQNFLHEMNLKTVSKDSIYEICLTPNHMQYMSADLHDTRIMDADNNEVPYVILSEPLLKAKSSFVPYEIHSQKHFNSYSEIIIVNANKDNVNNIAFDINNSDAYKYCSIEGSDDLKQWYSVSALQELSLAYNDLYTNQYKCIYFPLNKYKYFKLSVDDWQASPLKINSAGYFKNSVIAGKLSDVSFDKQITEDKKLKKTKVTLTFKNNQTLNRIDFKIASPRLFNRHAIIYVIRERQLKHQTENYQEVLTEIDLKADELMYFDIPAINEKKIVIEIDNKDNPPLQITDINCKQLATYLVCDLKANQAYKLKCGNSKLKKPEYDLGSFVSQVPQLLPEVELTTITDISPVVKKTELKEVSFFETKAFLWVCLAIGAVVIFFFSKSLLKDMGKKD